MPVDLHGDRHVLPVNHWRFLFIHSFFFHLVLYFNISSLFFNSLFPSFSIYLFVTMISSVPGDVLAKKLVLVAPLPFEVNARIWKL